MTHVLDTISALVRLSNTVAPTQQLALEGVLDRIIDMNEAELAEFAAQLRAIRNAVEG